MLTRAAETLERAGMAGRVDLVNADLAAGLDGLGLARASVVTVCWTLQFLQPERRLALLRDAFELLVPGGVLLLTEKTVAMDSAVDELFTSLYYELKRRSGYSATEIARKRESLEGVLVPMTIADNLAILREAGFPAPTTFFQWCPFAAFLAVKPTG
jgi:tRNA (cmo5U34)-methyltransferase